MSNCIPCSPCSNNCPNDGEIIPTSILDDGEVTASTVLDPEDCNTNCCWKSCSDNRWVNIQSSNPECLRVNTSECWVITLEPVCPPVVVAWDNVTVEVEDCEEDNCSKKYIVNANCDDRKVAACDGDIHPWTLSDKIEAWDWINISTQWCNWWDGHLVISVDPSVYDDENNKVAVSSNCWARYLEEALKVSSEYIKMEKNWCELQITDKTPKSVYAKSYLTADYLWTPVENWLVSRQKSPWTGEMEDIDFMLNSHWDTEFVSWEIKVMPDSWWIVIRRRWMYIVWFNGSMELSYWVHALRWMLYRLVYTWNGYDYYTVVESRFSWALWQRPCDLPKYATQWSWDASWDRRFVTWVTVSWWWESPARASVDKSTFWSMYKIDWPLFSKKTETEWQPWDGYSASLGAYMDRVPIWWTTILELNAWDVLFMWVKVSAEVTYWQRWNQNDGDIFHTVNDDTDYNYWHYAVLWRIGWSDARIWGERWASIFASLIQPIPWW